MKLDPGLGRKYLPLAHARASVCDFLLNQAAPTNRSPRRLGLSLSCTTPMSLLNTLPSLSPSSFTQTPGHWSLGFRLVNLSSWFLYLALPDQEPKTLGQASLGATPSEPSATASEPLGSGGSLIWTLDLEKKGSQSAPSLAASKMSCTQPHKDLSSVNTIP